MERLTTSRSLRRPALWFAIAAVAAACAEGEPIEGVGGSAPGNDAATDDAETPDTSMDLDSATGSGGSENDATAEASTGGGGAGGGSTNEAGESDTSDSGEVHDTEPDGAGGAGGAGGSGGTAGAGGTGGAGGSAGTDAGPTAFLETGGAVSIEAEHYTDIAPGTGAGAGVTWVNVTSPAGLSGTAEQAQPLSSAANVGDTTVGPRLDFKIKFADTGPFFVWIRIHGDTDKADSVHVAVDTDAPVTYGGRGMSDHTAGWAWVNAVDGGVASVKIPVATAGYHTLHVYMREAGVYVDKIVLNKSATAPTGTGPNESARE